MYRIGDRFEIEIDSVMDNKKGTLYGIKGFKSLVFDEYGLGLLEKCETEEIEDEDFEVGDEVYTRKDAYGKYLDVGIVTSICDYGVIEIAVMSKYGSIYSDHKKESWHKTGVHFNLDLILNEVGKQ